MAPSCLRLVPTDARNFTSFDLNKPLLLLQKVVNLNSDFKGDFRKKAMAFTPTLSSPQPQGGAMAGRLTKVLLSTIVAGPQEVTLNFNASSSNPAPPTDTNKGSFRPSLLPSGQMMVWTMVQGYRGYVFRIDAGKLCWISTFVRRISDSDSGEPPRTT